jgi:hypothetical protein
VWADIKGMPQPSAAAEGEQEQPPAARARARLEATACSRLCALVGTLATSINTTHGSMAVLEQQVKVLQRAYKCLVAVVKAHLPAKSGALRGALRGGCTAPRLLRRAVAAAWWPACRCGAGARSLAAAAAAAGAAPPTPGRDFHALVGQVHRQLTPSVYSFLTDMQVCVCVWGKGWCPAQAKLGAWGAGLRCLGLRRC